MAADLIKTKQKLLFDEKGLVILLEHSSSQVGLIHSQLHIQNYLYNCGKFIRMYEWFLHMEGHPRHGTQFPGSIPASRPNWEGVSKEELVLDVFQTEGRLESKDFVEQIPLFTPKVNIMTHTAEHNGRTSRIAMELLFGTFSGGSCCLGHFPEGGCAPRSFSIFNGYISSLLNEDWFTEEEVEQFYDKLESLGAVFQMRHYFVE